MARTLFPLGPLALTAALFLTASAPGAAGQTPYRLTVMPTLGMVDPRGAVPQAPILDAGVIGYANFEARPAFGAALEVAAGDVPVTLRLSAVRSLAGDETGQWSCAPVLPGADVACPDILIRIPTDVSVTSVGLDLGGRIPFCGLGFHPLLGAGLTRYGYRWDPGSEGFFSLEPGKASATDLSVRAGLGVSVLLVGSTRLRAEWLESFVGGDVLRSRPERLSSFSVGTEIVLAR